MSPRLTVQPRTIKRKNKNGSVVAYYQLAHNNRHPETRKPVANVIHSFGRTDQLDRGQLVRLTRSIARVCDLTVLDPQEPEDSCNIPATTAGLPADLKIRKTVSLGPMLAIEAIWKKIGLHQTLTDIIKAKELRVPYERALLAMVANRLCEPESKLGVWDRWLEKVHLPSCQGLKLRQMYDAMDFLYAHIEKVEKTIFNNISNLFNLSVDLIFHDTTTASFSADYPDDITANPNATLRRFGKAREGDWSLQVVVALAVTREGIPVRSWVLPGNTADVSTVKKIRADLRGWNLGRTMFVADAGMNSEDNRAELAKACGKYLLACRMASVSEIKNKVLSKKGRYTVISDNLQAKEVIIGDGERRKRYILCHNPKEAKRQQEHRAGVVSFLEKEIERHRDKLAARQWAMELLTSRRYKRYLTVTKANKIRMDRGRIRESAKYDGKWVIETNDDTISLEDAACGYKSLMVIERCFRSLKRSQIKMTPMYHWTSKRIKAHVKICVPALMIERIAELECKMPWHRIYRSLGSLQATIFFNLKYRVLMRNEIISSARNILDILGVKPPKQIIKIEKRL